MTSQHQPVHRHGVPNNLRRAVRVENGLGSAQRRTDLPVRRVLLQRAAAVLRAGVRIAQHQVRGRAVAVDGCRHRGAHLVATALEALGSLPSLGQLTLNFCDCSRLADVSALTVLASSEKLTRLTLDFTGCSQLADVSVLEALSGLQKLGRLALDFRYCIR